MMKPQLNLPLIWPVLGRCGPVFGPLPVLQAHSCLHVLQYSLAHYNPQVQQSEQSEQLRLVFLEPPLAHISVAELAFDHPKRMLDLSPDAGLELFGFLKQLAPGRVPVLATFVRAQHRLLPLHAGSLGPLIGALVARISKHLLLLAMQQAMALRDIADVARADDGVHQT